MTVAQPSLRRRFGASQQWVSLGIAALVAAALLALVPLSAAQRIALGSLLFLSLYLALLAQSPDRAFRYLLAGPSIVIMAAITIVPVGYLVWLSLHEVTIVNFLKSKPFTGIKNYLILFLDDPLFVPVLIRSLELLLVGIVLQLVLGLSLALLCNREFRLRPVITTILLLPIMTSSIVVGMLWKSMLGHYNGFINLSLQRLGLAPQPWLTNEGLPVIKDLPYIGPWLVNVLNLNFAFLSIVLTNTWQWTPMVFLLLWGGLAALPQDVFEAARIDGATGWQTLRYVTIPMLRPIIGVVVVIRGIDIMKMFGMIWALFGNASMTRTLNIHIYTIGMASQNYGVGAALSLLVAGIMVGLFLVSQASLARRDAER